MSTAPGGRRLFAGLLAALWLAPGAVAAQAAADGPAARMDSYFSAPNTPETFRALTGMGDPRLEAAGREAPWYSLHGSPDDALYRRLIPTGDASYFNPGDCRPQYAVETLRARQAQLGADNPYVRRWVEAQQAVFQACAERGGAAAAPAFPPALPIEDKALARLQSDDRAYQLAALAFYKDDIAAALPAFSKIAHSASPHRAAAIYMAAAIRAGSRKGWGAEAKPMIPPAQSIAEVQKIIVDPALVSIQPEARDLLGWIAYNAADAPSRRTQVHGVLADLEIPAAVLARDAAAQRRYALARDDIQYLHRYDGDPGWWLGAGPPADFTASQAVMDEAKTDPLAAWLLFPASYVQGHAWAPFADEGALGWEPLRTYAKEAAGKGGPAAFAWARVVHATANNYEPELWAEVEDEEVRAGRGEEPAIAALAFDFYHQVRRAVSQSTSDRDAAFEAALTHARGFAFKDSGTFAAARRDALQYLMTAGRLGEARRWRDGLYVLPKDAEGEDAALLQILAEDEGRLAQAFGEGTSESTFALQNNLSIAALRSLAGRSDVPLTLRAKFARIAWSRTYALGRVVDADLDRQMRALNPAMTKGWTSPAGHAIRPNDRRALLDVLRAPGVNILIVDSDRDAEPKPDQTAFDGTPGLTAIDVFNHDDDNWWCAWKRGRNARDLEALLKGTFFGTADFNLVPARIAYDLRGDLRAALAQSYAFKNQDPAETEALAKASCAPRMLTERVLDWVRHPGWFETRAGQDEALALAVRTTRYGCYSDGPHGVYSKAAWTLLHQRFPTSAWAVKTKYWFNCPFGDKECPAREDD